MDLQKLSLFRMMSDKMDWLAQRQQVLSQNVANADTPEYAARDLKPLDFRDVARREKSFQMQLAVTNAAHIRPATNDVGPHPVTETRRPYETSPSGNSVVLEEQLIKVAETAADFQTATKIYSKYLQMFRIAIGRGAT